MFANAVHVLREQGGEPRVANAVIGAVEILELKLHLQGKKRACRTLLGVQKQHPEGTKKKEGYVG